MQKFASSVLRRSPIASTRSFATLVLAEHFEGRLSPTLASVLNAATQLNDN